MRILLKSADFVVFVVFADFVDFAFFVDFAVFAVLSNGFESSRLGTQ